MSKEFYLLPTITIRIIGFKIGKYFMIRFKFLYLSTGTYFLRGRIVKKLRKEIMRSGGGVE